MSMRIAAEAVVQIWANPAPFAVEITETDLARQGLANAQAARRAQLWSRFRNALSHEGQKVGSRDVMGLGTLLTPRLQS